MARPPGPEFTVGSLTDLPYPDDRFAGVMLWYSIIHTPPAGLARIFAEVTGSARWARGRRFPVRRRHARRVRGVPPVRSRDRAGAPPLHGGSRCFPDRGCQARGLPLGATCSREGERRSGRLACRACEWLGPAGTERRTVTAQDLARDEWSGTRRRRPHTPPRGGSEGRRQPGSGRATGVSTQNSLPSGSAITTQPTSPWPMSRRVAPGDETVDLRLLITVGRWSEVEMQPVLPGLRRHRRTAPRDLRTAGRRLDRGLLVLVPDQRPAQRLAPEVPDLLRTVTGQALRGIRSRLGSCCPARSRRAHCPRGRRAPRDPLPGVARCRCWAPSPSARATVDRCSSREVLVRWRCIWFGPAFCSWACWNWMLNPVSSLGSSVRPSSAISLSSTPAQKRARRSGSSASKQSARRREVIPYVRSAEPRPRKGTSCREEGNARSLGDGDATRITPSDSFSGPSQTLPQPTCAAITLH